MIKIALDAGHGFNTPGKRTPDGEREWAFNNKVLLACMAKLNTYENVQIKRLDDPTGKSDVPLVARTNVANHWGANVLVSIHHNANTGKWGSHGGVETYIQPDALKASNDIAVVVHPLLVESMGLRDRGVKTKNLHMTRESKMPSILTEGGFMDSTTDIDALRNDEKLGKQGEAIADGLATYFKLKPRVARDPDSSKEELRMFNPTSKTLKDGVINYLDNAVHDKIINEKWLKQAKQGQLKLDDLVGLQVEIENRRKVTAK